MRRAVGSEEELGVTFADDGTEGGSVRRVFGHGFAEGEGGGDSLVDCQGEVMGRDGGTDVGRKGLDLV
jgi:hypothetical protein